jgi:hypothetical protein
LFIIGITRVRRAAGADGDGISSGGFDEAAHPRKTAAAASTERCGATSPTIASDTLVGLTLAL